MTHVAIMKKSWGLIDKILHGEKTIETRWYKNKSRPWNKVNKGDVIYFKNSGEQVTAKAVVQKVEQFSELDAKKIDELLANYGESRLGITEIFTEIRESIKDKKYAIFIHLDNPKKVQPFDIDKTGFGAMSAWISVNDIASIRK